MALGFEFVVALAMVYGTSYLLKFLERYDIPVLAVEILAGIIFGAILGIVGPSIQGYGFITGLAAFGLMMIMFDAGLELDPEIIRKNPYVISKLAVMTFFLPFLSGIGLAIYLGLSPFAAFLVGITISTTSLGLVYPLLEDFNMLETDNGQIILSVTVMNDILSVIALAYGITLITAPNPVIGAVTVTAALAAFFVIFPVFLVGRVSELLENRVFDNPVKFGIFLTVLFAAVFEYIGIHAILGAFFAGLLIAEITHKGHNIERSMKPVLNLAAPVFFFYVGMNVDLGAVQTTGTTLLLLVIAVGVGAKVIGSLIGGFITTIDRSTTVLMAAVMPGRLSISVAAAEIGRAQGIISPQLYDAFIILSVLSVFLSSLAFRYTVKKTENHG